jgi:protein gp37
LLEGERRLRQLLRRADQPPLQAQRASLDASLRGEERQAAPGAAAHDLPQHTFQILTKRPERMATWPGPWPVNVWAGTSVEDRRVIGRIDHLRLVPAAVRFISFEPLIGAVGDVDLSGIHWAIVGGESGPGYRPMDVEWARELRDQCLAQRVAFFFKQSSGPRTEMAPELDGVRWEQYPAEVAS